MNVELDAKVLIRGGIFTVTSRSLEKTGFWLLMMNTKHVRKKRQVSIELPEAEVLQGIADYEIEMTVRECAREESPHKDVARLKFLPTH